MGEKPVTIIVKHNVLPGKEKVFEQWVAAISQSCKRYSGYMGTELIRPLKNNDHNFACVFRFDSVQNMEKWMASKERETHINKLADIGDSMPDYQQYNSLEFWFEPEVRNLRLPSRHKMALVTFFVILALVHFLVPVITVAVNGALILNEVITVALIVFLMTYVIMPIITRTLKKWLYE